MKLITAGSFFHCPEAGANDQEQLMHNDLVGTIKRAVGTAIVLAAAVVTLPGTGRAQQPPETVSATVTTTSIIYACYVPKSGSVYRIKVANTPAECHAN